MIVRSNAPTRYVVTNRTLVEQLNETARTHGREVAVVAPQAVFRWDDVRTKSRAIAKGLAAQGIKRGDHIAVWLPNHPEWFFIWLAAAHIGAVTVPINTRYGEDEFRYLLRHSDAVALFMADSFRSQSYEEIFGRVDPGSHPEEFPKFRFCVATRGPIAGTLSLADFEASGSEVSEATLEMHAKSVDAEDTTIIVYTSGSTGRPKGVMHSHRVLRQAAAITEWLRIDTDGRILGHMPFFHVAGAFGALLPALISGCRVVLMDAWDVELALVAIEEHRITVFGGIATHFIDLLEHPSLRKYSTESLAMGWMGGAMTPRDVLQKAAEELTLKVLPVYGMTETTAATTYPRPTDDDDVLLSGAGLPISDFELKIVDLVTGQDLAAGTPGEVCVRGHPVMQGYYKDEEETARVIDDGGWFHSGDIGILDASGYLRIVGRVKEMMIVGGNNVFPAEIERVINECPGVVQAHVVAVPDHRLGEVPVAFIQSAPSADVEEKGVDEWCSSRLPAYKRPRAVMLVQEWPQTGSGKIDRITLQARAIGALGLEEIAQDRLLRYSS